MVRRPDCHQLRGGLGAQGRGDGIVVAELPAQVADDLECRIGMLSDPGLEFVLFRHEYGRVFKDLHRLHARPLGQVGNDPEQVAWLQHAALLDRLRVLKKPGDAPLGGAGLEDVKPVELLLALEEYERALFKALCFEHIYTFIRVY